MLVDAGSKPFGSAAIALCLLAASCSDSGGSRDEEPGRDTPFEIVVLGASAAKGQPYERRLGFGRLAEFLFGGKIDGREVEVVNLARPGITSNQVLEAAREIDPGADVVFLYAGNNEFLGFSGQFTDVHSERTLFDRATVGSETRADTLKRYRANLQATIEHVRSLGVPLVISTIAVNESDWAPNRSQLRDATNRDPIAQLLEEADRAIGAQDFDRAVSLLEKALEIEPTFAWTSKRLADAYRALESYGEAKRHYQNAIGHDGYPIRAMPVQNDTIRELARTYDLPLVDGEKRIADLSPTGLVGYNLMWDNCHPVLEGYLAIADELAQRIETLFPDTAPRKPRTVQEVEKAFEIGKLEARMYATRAQYLYGSSLFIWEPTPRLDRAEYYLAEVESRQPPDAELLSSRAILSALRKQPRASLENWRRAFELDSQVASRRFGNQRAREVLERAGIEAEVARMQSEASRR